MTCKGSYISLKFAVWLAVVCLAGCKDRIDIAAAVMGNIDIRLDTVRATCVKATITPENNSGCYVWDLLLPEDLAQYPTDDEVVASRFETMLRQYEQLCIEAGETLDFSDIFLYHGPLLARADVKPGTDNQLIAFQVNPASLKPVGKLYRMPFHSPVIDSSDVVFSIFFEGAELHIEPSNDDTYLWDYDLVKDVYDDYGTPEAYMRELVEMYENYGFIDMEKTVGSVVYDMPGSDPSLVEGREYYLFAVGYNGELNSEPALLRFVYHATGSEILEVLQ